MKKFKFLLFALAVVAFASCGNSDKKQSAEGAVQSDSLQRVITQKDNEINDMMETFNQIQEGLREIDEAQNRVSIVKNGEGANKRRQIIENIQFISNTMKQNRALIEKLRQQMRESSVKGDQLRKTIEDLVKQIDEKDNQLKQLRAELDAKDIHIAEHNHSQYQCHAIEHIIDWEYGIYQCSRSVCDHQFHEISPQHHKKPPGHFIKVPGRFPADFFYL